MRLEGVQLGVADLDAAVRAYTLLLGVAPAAAAPGVQRFALGRGMVELIDGDPARRALRFVAEPGEVVPEPAAFHGLEVVVGTDDEVQPPADGAPVLGIDHFVVRTPDPERAIGLWRDRLGLRLAFDRAFPERGLRLLFFRSGGLTLEFATSHPPPAEREGPDQIYGVSYRVADLVAHRARLLAAGVDVSDVRPGNKTGTRVASVRSGTAEVPTLLLEEAPRPA